MESVAVSGVLTFGDTDKLLDFVHFGEQLLVLSVNELNLALLTEDLLLGLTLVVVFT